MPVHQTNQAPRHGRGHVADAAVAADGVHVNYECGYDAAGAGADGNSAVAAGAGNQ